MVSNVIFALIRFSSWQNGGTSHGFSNNVLSLASMGMGDASGEVVENSSAGCCRKREVTMIEGVPGPGIFCMMNISLSLVSASQRYVRARKDPEKDIKNDQRQKELCGMIKK